MKKNEVIWNDVQGEAYVQKKTFVATISVEKKRK